MFCSVADVVYTVYYTYTKVYMVQCTFPRMYSSDRRDNMESLRPISVYQPVGLRPPLTSKLSLSLSTSSLSRSVNADGLHLYIMLSQERQGQKCIWHGGGRCNVYIKTRAFNNKQIINVILNVM
jgi:hypothetical protein